MHGSISGELYVDGTKPEVSINSVTPEYLSKDDILTIEYETSDNLSGSSQTDITILNNKGETVLIDKMTNVSGTIEYACSELDSLIKGGDPEEGSYRIMIETVDKAGNIGISVLDNAFTVDTTPPEPAITSFNSQNPIYINSDTNYLNMNYKTQDKNFASAKLSIDHNRGYIFPDNLEYNIPEGPNTIELYIVEYAPERGYDIELTVTDKAGNKKVVTETDAIIVDNTAPDFPVSIEGISYSLDDNLLNKKEIADELIMNYDDEIRVHFHNTDSINHYYPYPVTGDVVTIYSDSDPEINSVQLNSSDIEKGYVDIKIPSYYFESDGSDDGVYKINAKITDKADNCNGGINSPYEMRVDTTPPELISAAAVDAYHVVLTMDEKLLTYRLPTDRDNLNIMVEGNNFSDILDVIVSGSKVTLLISANTSDRDITEGSSIKMNYWPMDYRYSNFDDTYFADRAGNIMPKFYVDVENKL